MSLCLEILARVRMSIRRDMSVSAVALASLN